MILFSDAHIDNGFGAFSPHKKRFHNFLDFAEGEDLCVAGDLFEWWKFSPEETMAANMDVISRLRDWKHQLILIPGNHDLRATLLAVMFPLALIVPVHTQFEWTIIHGHRFDNLLDTKTERRISALAARLFQSLHWQFVDGLVDRFTSAKRANEPYMKELKQKAPTKKFILGHTHVPIQTPSYMNTGSVSNEVASYIHISKGGSAKLRIFK